jgi:penicillin-binding protein 1A
MPILSLPLGANEITMIDMLRAYGCMASSGKLVDPIAILRIEDRNGVEIFRHRIRERVVYDANVIHALVDLMKGVVLYGTGRSANLPRPMAGKTGTTNDHRDAWFIGFTPQLVTAAWVGNDDNSPMHTVTGGWWPARIWRQYMKEATDSMPLVDFPRPQGLVEARVCWAEGKLARPECPETIQSGDSDKPVRRVTVEKYWAGRQPKEECSLHDPANPDFGKPEAPVKTLKDEPWMEDFFE